MESFNFLHCMRNNVLTKTSLKMQFYFRMHIEFNLEKDFFKKFKKLIITSLEQSFERFSEDIQFFFCEFNFK